MRVFLCAGIVAALDRGACELQFLEPSEQDWPSAGVLANSRGLPFTGAVPLRSCSAAAAPSASASSGADSSSAWAWSPAQLVPDAALVEFLQRRHARALQAQAQAQTDEQQDEERQHEHKQGGSGGGGGGDEKEKEKEKGRARAWSFGAPDLYAPSPVSTLDGSSFAMVQLVESMQAQESLAMKQVLEPLVEPIVALGIPVIVSLVVQMIRDMSITAIGTILGPILVRPLIPPLVKIMAPLPVDAEKKARPLPYNGAASLVDPNPPELAPDPNDPNPPDETTSPRPAEPPSPDEKKEFPGKHGRTGRDRAVSVPPMCVCVCFLPSMLTWLS